MIKMTSQDHLVKSPSQRSLRFFGLSLRCLSRKCNNLVLRLPWFTLHAFHTFDKPLFWRRSRDKYKEFIEIDKLGTSWEHHNVDMRRFHNIFVTSSLISLLSFTLFFIIFIIADTSLPVSVKHYRKKCYRNNL